MEARLDHVDAQLRAARHRQRFAEASMEQLDCHGPGQGRVFGSG
jgi:hypothetical protein